MFLKQLQYLREIERYKSFSKAAKACGVSQPALSRAIRQLEDELGVVIIDRKKKVFGITGDGTRVLKWAHDILRGISELRNEVSVTRQAIAGIVKIGVIPTAVHIVPLLLEAVQERCGDFASEVHVLPNVAIIEKLVSKEIDIGIMYYDQCPQAKSFEVHTLYAEQQVLAASGAFQLPDGEDISWDAASRVPLALLIKEMRCRQLVDVGFQTAGVEPTIRLETNSLELIHAEVMAGKVATILPISSFPLRVPSPGRLKMRRLPGFSPGAVGVVRLSEPATQEFAAEVWDSVLKTRLQDDLDLLCKPSA
ncbi:LysR family transcriptional regulator [Gluconacetobacter tumulisoli]|uniref:LysR family transcriptional regulator n=1 Tax=Gluconacetobacter tumulisoli TaxID=1286189 RepID=A0A7W4K8D3_9PROT|nr:LysR family transcriptional regulator [Gluconacetobacter tumulisoli]MBB2202216.1 LysR family transcriptional regulator [Gluconacetobacter tumulisoli]